MLDFLLEMLGEVFGSVIEPLFRSWIGWLLLFVLLGGLAYWMRVHY